jgi:threonine/homoserine efflux transporter RhtA
MNRKIENLKPVAVSWAVTGVLLLIATVYDFITEGSFGITGIIFFSSLAAYFAAYLIFGKK